MEQLSCLPSVQICFVLAVLHNINYITLFMPECFVLRMDKFLPQRGFEVNQDMMFIVDPPEFLRCSSDEIVTFSRLLWIF